MAVILAWRPIQTTLSTPTFVFAKGLLFARTRMQRCFYTTNLPSPTDIVEPVPRLTC